MMTDINFAGVGMPPALANGTGDPTDDPIGDPPSTYFDEAPTTMWHGRILERGLPGGSKDHVVVYSNIRVPWAETFEEAYGRLDFTATPVDGTRRPRGLADCGPADSL